MSDQVMRNKGEVTSDTCRKPRRERGRRGEQARLVGRLFGPWARWAATGLGAVAAAGLLAACMPTTHRVPDTERCANGVVSACTPDICATYALGALPAGCLDADAGGTETPDAGSTDTSSAPDTAGEDSTGEDTAGPDTTPDATPDTTPDTTPDATPDTAPHDCSAMDSACRVGTWDPAAGACAATPRPDGTACDDGDACTSEDQCTAGTCTGTAKTCDDGLACTEDGCDPTTGACTATPTETCGCHSDTDCDDGNDCTTDTCGPDWACHHEAAQDGSPCDDADACTGGDACQQGACVGTTKDCADAVACTEDACDPTSGACQHTPTADCECLNDAHCEDGNPCTADTCESNWSCGHTPAADGTTCEDGNACTTGDQCAGGSCLGQPTTCDDGVACTADACDALTGACEHTPTASCQCLGDAQCDDSDPCTVDACGADWTCTHTAAPAGAACDDGNACTLNDTCGAGGCAGTPLDCDDGVACSVDVCDGATGHCVHDLAACGCVGDGDCDDGDPCTVDVCNAQKTCENSPGNDGATCDDGDPCTVGDACSAGVCGGAAKDCDDGLACTPDLCLPTDGTCVHDDKACACTQDSDCDDGAACTVDACDTAANACTHTPQPGTCFIDGACYGAGDPSPAEPGSGAVCGVCSPTLYPDQWAAVGGTNPWLARDGFWANSGRKNLTRTPYCNPVAILVHNCYATTGTHDERLAATRSKLIAAIDAGADAVELDVREEGGVLYVAHLDDGDPQAPTLDEVLDTPELVASDVILFLESKEETTFDSAAELALAALRQHGLAGAHGREVIYRAFSGAWSEAVYHALDLVAPGGAFEDLAPHLKTSVLYSATNSSAETNAAGLDGLAAAGIDMVELPYQHRELLTILHMAHARGLGTNVWTLPPWLGEMSTAALQEDVDAITTDVSLSFTKQLVTETAPWLRLDASEADLSSSDVSYFQQTMGQLGTFPVGLPQSPILGAATPFQGASLLLDSTAQRAATLYETPLDGTTGVFVSLYAAVDDLALAAGEIRVLVGKQEGATGFTLELYRPVGSAADGTLLRFGVGVGGAMRYATVSASKLTVGVPSLIAAGYDGDGGVRLLVNGSDAGVSAPYAKGGVDTNASPVTLGADPQGATGRRFFVDAHVQSLTVRYW